MKKSCLIMLLAVLFAGCAGPKAREQVLCPAIGQAWASVRADAEPAEPMDAAVADCQCPDLPMAWAVTTVTPSGARFVRAEKIETLRLLDEMITLICEE